MTSYYTLWPQVCMIWETLPAHLIMMALKQGCHQSFILNTSAKDFVRTQVIPLLSGMNAVAYPGWLVAGYQ